MDNRVNICGAYINDISLSGAIEAIKSLVKKDSPAYLVTPNIDHIVKINKDAGFKEAYDNASLAFADGMPILWAARFLGTPIREKISGSDLFPELCKLASEEGYKLFFLGGRPRSALKASEILKNRYPDLNIKGIYAPPFGFENNGEENSKIIKMIREAGPDILFVGLGAPKQEKWIYRHYKELNVPVSIGIGAAFDFISGAVKRAPLWMQKSGLEWLWRLMMEPARLWKRYLVDDMEFFRLVLKQKSKK